MDGSRFTPVARVVKTRGLDGDVVVSMLLECEPSAALMGLELWPVPPLWVPRPLHACHVLPGRAESDAVVAFTEVSDVMTARRLVGSLLLAETAALPELPVSRSQALLGVEVTDEARGALGTIADIIITGANDVWVVHGPFGEVLIPVIPDVVLDVDLEKRTALVRLLPGLLDEKAEA